MNPRRNIQAKRRRKRRAVERVRAWLNEQGRLVYIARLGRIDREFDIVKCTACRPRTRPNCYWCHGVGKMLCE